MRIFSISGMTVVELFWEQVDQTHFGRTITSDAGDALGMFTAQTGGNVDVDLINSPETASPVAWDRTQGH